ncbi:hypothetical protein MPC4_260039 [Methylocella tundrae]|uniref:Uncharacterized protein n=1 Tax=Methylocella tundrae TaxID=227605 RepID=A0A8B6M8P6_METTU|nr:hypothetical protein [Methylocella tundrae]VTZ27259.1 hypothetical protein MPC1_5010001 [Methylocella tundrae]VTZ50602.1 hypothetical protein MPC4_260039 [Methylocella tundrae]
MLLSRLTYKESVGVLIRGRERGDGGASRRRSYIDAEPLDASDVRIREFPARAPGLNMSIPALAAPEEH